MRNTSKFTGKCGGVMLYFRKFCEKKFEKIVSAYADIECELKKGTFI
jgi:hypothetical protein